MIIINNKYDFYRMVFGNKYIRNRRLLCADHNGQSLLILSLVENHFVLCFRNKAYSLIVLFVAPISFSVFFFVSLFSYHGSDAYPMRIYPLPSFAINQFSIDNSFLIFISRMYFVYTWLDG